MKTVLRLLMVALLFGVFYGGLLLQRANSDPVTVSYGAGEFPTVLQWQALAVAFGAGVLVTGVFLSLRLIRGWLAARRYRKEIVRLEDEIQGLRNLPVVDGAPAPAAVAETASEADEVTAPAGAAGSSA